MRMIIPYYAGGFNCDWTKTIPINEKDIAMYLKPNVRIVFRDIWSEQSQRQFRIGQFMEACEDIDCKSFRTRYRSFSPFVGPRVQRTFDKKRESIFFDMEEVAIMAMVFSEMRLTAIVEVEQDDKVVEIKDMSSQLYDLVQPYLYNYKVRYDLTVDQYRDWTRIKKARVVNKKGEEFVMKQKLKSGGLILGAMALGALGIGMMGIVAPKMLKEGWKYFYAPITDVEVIDDLPSGPEEQKPAEKENSVEPKKGE